MKTTNNGDKELSQDKDDDTSIVDRKLAEVTARVEEQTKLFGLERVNVDQSCVAYIRMSEDELGKLTPEELAAAEIKLSSYSFSLQLFLNKALSIKNWAERSLRLILIDEYHNFDKFMPYDARRDAVIKGNSYAKRLYDVINHHQVVIDEMTYLAQAAQHIAGAFGRYSRIRKGYNDTPRNY